MARAIRCPGASVPAATTAGPNPGGDAVAPLAFSLTAKRDNSACGRGGARCGDDIDWECGGRRQWATLSARVEIPTILGPERGLEVLTAVQWRQKLGLQDFRSDHVFLRAVAVKRMDEGVVQEWNSWCGLLTQTALKNSFFLPMVLRSSQRRGRAALPVLGCRRIWDLTWWRSQTSPGSSVCSLHVGGSVNDLRDICTSSRAYRSSSSRTLARRGELRRRVATCQLDRRFDLCLGCNSAKMQGQWQHCHGQPRAWCVVSGTTVVAC